MVMVETLLPTKHDLNLYSSFLPLLSYLMLLLTHLFDLFSLSIHLENIDINIIHPISSLLVYLCLQFLFLLCHCFQLLSYLGKNLFSFGSYRGFKVCTSITDLILRDNFIFLDKCQYNKDIHGYIIHLFKLHYTP